MSTARVTFEPSQSELHLQLLNAIPHAVVATDLAGRVVYWNKNAETLYGWRAEEAIGRAVQELLIAPDDEDDANAILEALRRGDVWNGEYIMRRRDGSEFLAEVTVAPQQQDGVIVGMVGFSREKGRQTARAVPTDFIEPVILELAHEGKLIGYAPADHDFFLVSNPIGRPIEEVLPRRAGRVARLLLREAAETGESRSFEFNYAREGVLHAIEAFFSPGPDNVSCVLRDVSGRRNLDSLVEPRMNRAFDIQHELVTEIGRQKEAQRVLRSTADQLRMLFDRAPVAMLELDAELRVLRWNAAAERLYGYTAAEATGRVHPGIGEHRMCAAREFVHGVMRAGTVLDIQTEARRSDGSPLFVSASVAPLPDESGEMRTCVAVVREVTMNRDTQAEIQEFSRRLTTMRRLERTLSRSLDFDALLQNIARELAHYGVDSGLVIFDEGALLSVAGSWGDADAETLTAALAAEWPVHGPVVLASASGFALPLRSPGAADGALVLTSRTPGVFTGEHREFFLIAARQITAALENAQLLRTVREAHERLRLLSRRLVAVQESERRLIGHELHDQVGQMITGLRLVIESAYRSDHFHEDAYIEAERITSDLLNVVRNLSLQLRPPMLDDSGLLAAVLWHVSRYIAQTSIPVDVYHHNIPRLDAERETAAFRIVQEALTNTARHAYAQEALLRLWTAHRVLHIEVQDNGVGFVTDRLDRRNSIGISGMIERAQALGGDVTIESAPGSGTRVSVQIPFEDTAE